MRLDDWRRRLQRLRKVRRRQHYALIVLISAGGNVAEQTARIVVFNTEPPRLRLSRSMSSGSSPCADSCIRKFAGRISARNMFEHGFRSVFTVPCALRNNVHA